MSTENGWRARLERLAAPLGRLVPPHAFVLTRDRLVSVSMETPARGSRAPLAGVSVRSAVLPEGTFREGPGGVGIAGPALADALAQVLGKNGKGDPAAASLSVPDGFVRTVAVDVEPGADRNPREVEEVLLWKLSRTFGDGAPALRISWQSAGAAPGGGLRILGIAAAEEAAASWEASFAARGIRIGLVVPEVLAVAPLARKALGGSGLFVWSNGGTLSTASYEAGALRFLRCKPEDPDPADTLQEIRLFASFAAGAPGGAGGAEGVAAVAGPESSAVAERFAAFRREAGGSEPIALRGLVASRGLAAGLGDPAVLAGVGLITGEE